MQHSPTLAAAALALALSITCLGQPAAAQTFRAEVHGGLDRLSGDVGKSGLLYGLGAGVDVQLGEKASIGLEANVDLSTVDGCARGVMTPTDTLCAKVQRDLSAVARLSYKLAPSTQIYALAGYSNARLRLDYTPATGPATSIAGNADGLRLGAGIQQGLGGGFYSKLEYRYSNYEADTVRHQVLVGLGVSF
ncbi:MAG: porin family protein [Alphaproteobacteria bacterium]|nr:MAG: porin family protein [Alphaproteobacteria bacterium]